MNRWQDNVMDTDRIDNTRWNGRIERKKDGKLWRCGHTTTDNSSYKEKYRRMAQTKFLITRIK